LRPIAEPARRAHHLRMPTYSVALLAILAAGCTHTVVDISNCANRVGTYRLTYTYRTGDCGAIPEQIGPLNDALPATVDPNCAALQTISNDHCAVNVDLTCLEMSGGKSHSVAIIRWSHDAASGTGSAQITATDKNGAFLCSGSYDLTDVRL
jgi:hypothetical protein